VASTASAHQVLPYATDSQELTESVLEVRDGAAILKLPPPARWIFTAMLVFFIACLIFFIGLSALFLIDYRTTSSTQDDVGVLLCFGFLACSGAYCAWQIVWAINALRKWRQLGNQLEATPGHLVYMNCGVWHNYRRQLPLHKIRNLRVDRLTNRARNGRYSFRLRAGRFVRRLRSSRSEFGSEVTAALRGAIGLPTLAREAAHSTDEEQTSDA
jgi:hypothetical protein